MKKYLFNRRHQELLGRIARLNSEEGRFWVENGEVVIDHPALNYNPVENTTVDRVRGIIQDLIPWRKGPYRITSSANPQSGLFSQTINSEWNSSIKWDRLFPHLKKILSGGELIADLGCNNGYFLFRLLDPDTGFLPRLAVGFEPVERNVLQYLFLSSPLRLPSSVFLLLGYEALCYFPKIFDMILGLGILYHHPDPIGILRLINEALKPGGWVVIDCQGIPGDEHYALLPHRRYAGKRNFWLLPTHSVLLHWLEKVGFQNIQMVGEYPLLAGEQRVTELAPGESLVEGLADPQNYFHGPDHGQSAKTIEGYPAPVRFYLIAQKNPNPRK